MTRVVVVGDALIDELRDRRGVRELIGGAGLNVAVGVSRLGVPATLVAMVGDDESGAHIRGYLHDHGVELIATPAPVSARAVSVRSGGEPRYSFNEAARSRAVHFGTAREAIAAAPAVVVSSFPFDDAVQAGELMDAVAHRAGPFAVDPNPRPGLLRDQAAFVRGFEAAAARADLVKISDDDARLLYESSLDEASARLVGLGARAVLATAGAMGARVDTAALRVERAVPKLPGRIVDTMGAGDAALAATVAALVAATPDDAAEWGAVLDVAMAVAAATCRFEGGLLRHPSALIGRVSEGGGS